MAEVCDGASLDCTTDLVRSATYKCADSSGADCDVDDYCDGTVTTCPDAKVHDFTPCTLVTSPDRSYDICVSGVCVSPGCGDATCNAPGPNWTIPDTNQRSCFDEDTTMACSGTGGSATCGTTPFCGQDGQYGWDTTNPETARFTRTLPVSPGNEPVVLDNITGLMWMGCAEGQTGDLTTCTGTALTNTWDVALSDCDGLTWGGFTDWRLPDRYELQSIVDYGRFTPAISPTAFPGTTSAWADDAYFWSSSSIYGSATDAWVVGFCDGYMGGGVRKTSHHEARCVRTAAAAAVVARFVVTAGDEPIVSDSRTGLVWQGCVAGLRGSSCTEGSAGAYRWQEALAYCEGLTWGGYADWYLPNVKELLSISDDHGVCSASDLAFPNAPCTNSWTSSSYASDTTNSRAWFIAGNGVNASGKGIDPWINLFAVRCVRGGP